MARSLSKYMKKFIFTILNPEFPQRTAINYPLNRAQNLLSNLSLNHIASNSQCGGKAVCGKCRIQIQSGNKTCSKANAAEKIHLTEQEIQQGWRLACQTFCLKNISFYKPASDA